MNKIPGHPSQPPAIAITPAIIVRSHSGPRTTPISPGTGTSDDRTGGFNQSRHAPGARMKDTPTIAKGHPESDRR